MNKKSQIRLVKRSSCGIPPNSYIANPSKKICQNSTNENQPSNINQSLQTSRLFDLPQVIFHLIFGHYLKLHELVQFDIAVCNHSDRRKYLLLVENITFKSL